MPGALSTTSRDSNENRKFLESGGQVAVAVTNANGGSIGAGSFWTMPFDTVTVAYPDADTEVYSSRVGGIAGAVQQVVTINYVDSTKEFITDIVRS